MLLQIRTSAGNVIDHMTLCAELSFKRIIFIGAVGGLKDKFGLGDICTPLYSISGSYADSYLTRGSIRENMLFEKIFPDMDYVDEVIAFGNSKGYNIRKSSIFCTPSIALEYTDLIEMETSSFYLMTDLFELPGIALLVVSDNSASGAALVGCTQEQQEKYDYGRNVILPDMILTLMAE